MCGYCTTKEIQKLKQDVTKNSAVSRKQSFTEIVEQQRAELHEENTADKLKNIKEEEKRQKDKERNLVVLNPPSRKNKTPLQVTCEIIETFGVHVTPPNVEEIRNSNNRKMLIVQCRTLN